MANRIRIKHLLSLETVKLPVDVSTGGSPVAKVSQAFYNSHLA